MHEKVVLEVDDQLKDVPVEDFVQNRALEFRSLPRTINFLINGMSAVNFRKLNRVGENSRPNAFAMLFGEFNFILTLANSH